MAVSSDIIETYRRPRAVMNRLLSYGVREDRAIAFLMAACALVFISRLPTLSRQAFQTGDDFTRLASYEFFAWLMIWPLLFYVIGAVFHLIAKAVRGQGSWYGSRLAVFWTFLCGSPILLLYGLVGGFIGTGPQQNLVGLIWVAAIGYIGWNTLREAHRNVT